MVRERETGAVPAEAAAPCGLRRGAEVLLMKTSNKNLFLVKKTV
jgi:hypothetical protein